MGTNLARLAESALDRLGDHPSLYNEGTWYSSGAPHERSTRLATGLRGLGVAPGDRVVVFMANCPEVGLMWGRPRGHPPSGTTSRAGSPVPRSSRATAAPRRPG